MNVTVEYTAQLKRAAGVARESFELSDGCPLTGLLDAIVERHGDKLARMLKASDGSPQSTIVPFVGEEQVRWDAASELNDGDSVTLLSPISGG